MSLITMKQLLEAGVHFGHQTRRWNLNEAVHFRRTQRNFTSSTSRRPSGSSSETMLSFKRPALQAKACSSLGTKKQAQDAIYEEASRAGQFFVNQRLARPECSRISRPSSRASSE